MTGNMGFLNRRSKLWWKFRELLSPNQPAQVALPPDSELLAELSAPTYRMSTRGLQVESKADISKRVGRSIDLADAVVYCSARSAVLSFKGQRLQVRRAMR